MKRLLTWMDVERFSGWHALGAFIGALLVKFVLP